MYLRPFEGGHITQKRERTHFYSASGYKKDKEVYPMNEQS